MALRGRRTGSVRNGLAVRVSGRRSGMAGPARTMASARKAGRPGRPGSTGTVEVSRTGRSSGVVGSVASEHVMRVLRLASCRFVEVQGDRSSLPVSGVMLAGAQVASKVRRALRPDAVLSTARRRSSSVRRSGQR